MSMTGGHSKRASPALRALAEAEPALAALSLWCDHRDGDVTCTEGTKITYGPDFDGLARHEQIGLAAHHILHVALRHSARLSDLQARMGRGFDLVLYNLVADALVNEVLLLADHALPRPAVTLTGLLSKALGQDIAPEVALATWDVDRLYFALTGAEDKTGSSKEKVRIYAQKQSFEPDVAPTEEGAKDGDDLEQEARWRQNLTRAFEAGQQAGRGIGRIGHMFFDIPEPRVPWEVILRRLLARAVTVAPYQSTHRPARRWIASAAESNLNGDPTPGFEAGMRPLSDVPLITVALDASGSIDDARLAMFWAEVIGIARRMRAELQLLVFDDAIRYRARIDPSQTQVPLPDLPRGGGTAFLPAVAEARDVGAAALVILTDLEGDPGPPPRGLNVIWAVPDAQGMQPPYGRLIDLSH
jgi:predicted metal-dependent peptidase